MLNRIMLRRVEAADQVAPSVSHHLWRSVAGVGAFSVLSILAAVSISYAWFPTIPEDVRKEFERCAGQIDSPTISFSHQLILEQQLERLADATKSRSITNDECKAGIEAIRDTVIEYSLTQGLVKNYIDRSTLTTDEKNAAAQSLRRYAAYFFSGKLTEETAMAIESRTRVVDRENNGSRFRETLSDGELRDLLVAMNKAADTAGLASDIPPIDVCTEVRAIFDGQLRVR